MPNLEPSLVLHRWIESMRPAQVDRREEQEGASPSVFACLGRAGYVPGYEDYWRAVIRPPREMYTLMQLGPTEFMIDGVSCNRQDLTLTNVHGFAIAASHYFPSREQRPDWPCVVFCHGNSSSRLEAYECVKVCMTRRLSVFCFDFSGCGMSEGEYVTLGHLEQKDLGLVIEHLRQSGFPSIALWGRSMGASTAIFYAAQDHELHAVVLDSPFTALRTVAMELGNEALPKFMLNMGIDILRDEVFSRTGANMDHLSPIEHAPKARCPAIFGASVDDDFIQPHHSKELQQAWGGVSDLYYFSGGHNSIRPEWFMEEAADWLVTQFYPAEVSS